MKIIPAIILFLLPLVMFSQHLNRIAPDPKKGCELLVGTCSREGFAQIRSNFDSAYKAGYPLYQPEAATMEQLKPRLKGVKITVVMGTWCGDSREWVPRFYKIMDMAGFNEKHITLVCVDRDKKAGSLDISKLNVERVPTFIFYKKKKELGRIVEVPYDLLEKDMLKILTD